MVSWPAERRTTAAGLARVAAAGLAVLAAACAAPTPRGPVLLHPVPPPPSASDYALAQGALVFSGQDFTVSVRPWDYRLVAGELTRSGEPSPFGESEEDAGRFLFFRVRLENRSQRKLVFNPLYAVLLREGAAPIVPLENSDLLAFADEKIAAAEARSRAFRRLSFDGAATVRPGETLERYLVFPAPEEASKALTLFLDELWWGATSFGPKFVFETYPGK
jgi:hypothetical protein